IPFIFLSVCSYVDSFFVGLSDTLGLNGAVFAIATSGKIVILKGALFELLLAEGYLFSLWAQPVIPFFDINKTFRATFIGSMGRDKALDALSFKECIVLSAAVARVGHTVFPH